MKTPHISIILTLCIILSSVTLLSHADGGVQTIQLDLNKDSYFPGDVMSINGKLWLVNATQVTIGLEKNHALIVMTENVTVSKNETFATSFTIPKDMDAKSWSIVVNANDGTLIQDLDFHPPLLTLLQQVKSGIPIPDITCSNGLYLGVKSPNRDLVCLKAGTISKLASRGFFFGIDANKNEANYTTILIPPGSENQVSTNSYSPSVVTIEIGVNNTVRWVDQSDTADTIVPDMPLVQNGISFGSDGVIKPDQSYAFTFTEPGTFTYHTDPHPWMKGTVIVLPRSYQITSTTTNNPFGITALVIYSPQSACLSPPSHSTPSGLPICPPNNFYLKINSNSTAYLMGYNICDGSSCTANRELSLVLPLNTGLRPDYQMIGLPVNLQWRYGDTVKIQLYVSSTNDNKTASLVDLGDSKIVP